MVESNSSYMLVQCRHKYVLPATWASIKGHMVLNGSYEEAVKMMGGMNFMGTLLNFAKDTINDETVELLQPYFSASDFNFEAAKKVVAITLCRPVRRYCKLTN